MCDASAEGIATSIALRSLIPNQPLTTKSLVDRRLPQQSSRKTQPDECKSTQANEGGSISSIHECRHSFYLREIELSLIGSWRGVQSVDWLISSKSINLGPPCFFVRLVTEIVQRLVGKALANRQLLPDCFFRLFPQK